MKKLSLTIVLTLFVLTSVNSQSSAIRLTFTAQDNNDNYIELGEIKIINRTQGGDTTLYYPDTVLVLNNVGINDLYKPGEFILQQNYPNPVIDKTTIDIYVPAEDKVCITVSDIYGRRLISSQHKLISGMHSFIFSTGSEKVYFLTATWRGHSQSIKIISSGANNNCLLDYSGYQSLEVKLKSESRSSGFPFRIGDTLWYIGYATTLAGALGSDLIEDKPLSDNTYIFEITEGMPCPDVQTVTYQGKTYNTVLIGDQCWLKENLNVGIRINGSNNQMDNGVVEKYCYNDIEENCNIYGGLYQWDEMMQYTILEGAQGICPAGWHIPTDHEWKILEGTVDSQYPISNPKWDSIGWRGYDAGESLKSANGWYSDGNGTDLYGFIGLPGGYRSSYDGDSYRLSEGGYLSSSSQYDSYYAWYRYLNYDNTDVYRGYDDKNAGISVRCLQNPNGNIIKIHNVAANAGDQITVEVEIINKDAFSGFQFDISLPAGFIYQSASIQIYRTIDHVIFANILPGNLLRVLASSPTNAQFTGNSGIICTFVLNTPSTPGSYILHPEGDIPELINLKTIDGTVTLW